MSELEKLANTPRKFTILDKIYSVKQLSLFDISNLRESIIAHKKAVYKLDVAEMASVLPERDRAKVILETIKNYSVTDEDIQAEMVSKFGVVEALSLGLKIAKDVIEKLLSNDDLQNVLWDAYCHIMGIQSAPEIDKVEDKKD